MVSITNYLMTINQQERELNWGILLRSVLTTFLCSHDTTQTGHILGSPESRIGPPAPERSLSPPAVCIMRALMHSALLWCSCHYQDMMAAELVELVKPRQNVNILPEFFWMHLKKDIEQLSQVTGKGLEDSAIIVHLVLHGILTKESLTCKMLSLVVRTQLANSCLFPSS